jgi:NAD(P)-dependent dehydrogenase (short-subunit alcohol dehydrogenase family)
MKDFRGQDRRHHRRQLSHGTGTRPPASRRSPQHRDVRRLCGGDRGDPGAVRGDGSTQGLQVTAHIADVSDPAQVERFRDEVADHHDTDKIHLLFNNAGIGGGGSMIAHGREGEVKWTGRWVVSQFEL